MSNGSFLFSIAYTRQPNGTWNLSDYVAALPLSQRSWQPFFVYWPVTVQRQCGLSPIWSLQLLETDPTGALVFFAFDHLANRTAVIRYTRATWSSCVAINNVVTSTVALSPSGDQFAVVQMFTLSSLMFVYDRLGNVVTSRLLPLGQQNITGLTFNADGSFWLAVCSLCNNALSRSDSVYAVTSNLQVVLPAVALPYTTLRAISTAGGDLVLWSFHPMGQYFICLLLRGEGAPYCENIASAFSSVIRGASGSFLFYNVDLRYNQAFLLTFSRGLPSLSSSTGGNRPNSTSVSSSSSGAVSKDFPSYPLLAESSVYDWFPTPYRTGNGSWLLAIPVLGNGSSPADIIYGVRYSPWGEVFPLPRR